MTMEQLTGKTALVTGGGRGLGAAVCDVLSGCGVNVIAADVQAEAALNVAQQLQAKGGSARAVTLDVGDEGQAQKAVRQAVDEFGALDILINNAGVDVTCSIDEMTCTDWDRIIRVNLRGPFVMSKFALEAMRRQGSGHIVNISSTAAKRAWANASGYHASKWGLLGFSHALHVEARPHNVKVTAVISGGMRMPFLLDRFPDIDLNNLQDPRNVAETIRYVLSQPAGTVIPEVMVVPMRETSWP
jgi:NAD(P)-dependent dehydrogenase (short-subunit alcohol dehydrogenase family)